MAMRRPHTAESKAKISRNSKPDVRHAKSVKRHIMFMSDMGMKAAERFWSKVGQPIERADDNGTTWMCYPWNGSFRGETSRGDRKGQIHDPLGGMMQAAQLAQELYNGPVPLGYEVSHLCGWCECVRPQHVTAESKRANIARSGHRISESLRLRRTRMEVSNG